MSASDGRRTLEDLFANLQLRLINEKLSQIEKEKEERDRNNHTNSYYRGKSWDKTDRRPTDSSRRSPDALAVEKMDRYSPDYFRYSRYGRPHPQIDQIDPRPVLPHYGTALNPVILPPVAAPAPPQPPAPSNAKSDMMEMLMLQGAQMHQSVMQQMMLSSLRPHQQVPQYPHPPQPVLPPAPPPVQPPVVPTVPPPVPPPAAPTFVADRRQTTGDVLVPVSINDLLQTGRHSARSRRLGPASRRADSVRSSGRAASQRRAPTSGQEQLIPLSLARELLQGRAPSVHHHHHHPPQDETLFSPRVTTERQEVISRHAHSEPILRTPRTPIQLPPVQSPTWTQRPTQVSPLSPPPERRRTSTPTPVTPINVIPIATSIQQERPVDVLIPYKADPKPQQREPPPKQMQEQEAQTEYVQQDEPVPPPPKLSLPFPGSAPLRRFRKMGYVVLFSLWLSKSPIKKLNEDEFLLGIRLREIVKAAKTIYVNPEGDMMICLRKVTAEQSTDLLPVFASGTSKEQKVIFGRVADLLSDVVDVIGEIQPTSGVLSVNHKSAVHLLVQDGGAIPAGYLWDVEDDMLPRDRTGRTKDIREQEASVLLIGALVARGLVQMVLLMPASLPDSPPVQAGSKEANNLRVLGSLLVVIVLEAYKTLSKADKKQKVTFPPEITSQLCKMEEVEKFLDSKESSVKKMEKRLRQWAANYYKKLSQLNKTKR